MHSLRHYRRQVDDLQRRLKPVLAIFRLRNLAMEFCDEFDEVAAQPNARFALMNMSVKFMPRIRKAGFIIDTHTDLCATSASVSTTTSIPNPASSSSCSFPGPREALTSAPTYGSAPQPPNPARPPNLPHRHSRESGNPGRCRGVGNTPNPVNPLIP